jgi:hypothetical protein
MKCAGAGPNVMRGDGRSPVGRYLAEFNLEYAGGVGMARWVASRAEAIRFPSMIAAYETWRKVSATRPLRGDGKPNRPLTAYSVEFEDIP